jgi:hypothetical protein
VLVIEDLVDPCEFCDDELCPFVMRQASCVPGRRCAGGADPVRKEMGAIYCGGDFVGLLPGTLSS